MFKIKNLCLFVTEFTQLLESNLSMATLCLINGLELDAQNVSCKSKALTDKEGGSEGVRERGRGNWMGF